VSRWELEEERAFLLRSIRDLDAEWAAGEITDEDYRALRDGYAARAAAVLRALDAPPHRPAGVRTAGGRGPARSLPWRRVATVAAVLAVASIAGMAVAVSSGERLPGEQVSGSIEASTVDRITQAQLLVQQGKVLEAVKLYDQILRDDARNPVALAQRGWLVSRAGLVEEGLAAIEAAIATDPTYPDAHFFRGMILWRDKGDPAGAAEEFRLVLENRPPPGLVAYVEDARRRALADAAAGGSPPAGPP
jgi:tetratricopeptide (TPR) repeat protein